MANYSQTNAKQPLQPGVNPALDAVRALETTVSKGLPFTQYEFQTLNFGTAHYPLEIQHSLKVSDPDTVHIIPLRWEFNSPPLDAPVIYRDTARAARRDTPTTLIRKCSVGLVSVRVLIVAEVE